MKFSFDRSQGYYWFFKKVSPEADRMFCDWWNKSKKEKVWSTNDIHEQLPLIKDLIKYLCQSEG